MVQVMMAQAMMQDWWDSLGLEMRFGRGACGWAWDPDGGIVNDSLIVDAQNERG